MKVCELIARLVMLPPDIEVVIESSYGEFEPQDIVTVQMVEANEIPVWPWPARAVIASQ